MAGRSLHQLWLGDQRLDMVPFGGVERPDRTIEWPTEGTEVMNVLGLSEALAKAIAGLNVEGAKRIELEGEIEVPEEGTYELVFTASGAVSGRLAGVEFDAPHASSTRLAFAAATLSQGWSPIKLAMDLAAGEPPRLSALLSGHVVAAPLPAKALRQGQ